MSSQTETIPRPSPIILIVDDQDSMRGLLAEILGRAFPGCAILATARGADGVAICAEQKPDVVVMDVSLEDGNGVDFAAAIKERHPQTRVIVVSFMRTTVLEARAIAVGAECFLSKDRLYRDLLPAVRRAVAQSPGPE